ETNPVGRLQPFDVSSVAISPPNACQVFFFKQKTAYEIGLGIPAEPLFRSSVDRFVIVSIFIPKLRLILILNSFLGSSDSLVFSELFHSLAPRPLAARSISDFLLTYLAT